jgi:undecaprenyl diphosphate synthase
MQELPRHIAVIPDGNRRWAEIRGKPCQEGHAEGVKKFQEISRAAFEMGIPCFTFWAASEKNLTRRNLAEVEFLTSLFCEKLENEQALRECIKYEVRVKVPGRWNEILKNSRLLRAVSAIEQKTQTFKKHHLTLPFGYSEKQEMLQAIKNLFRYMLKKRP